MAYQNDLDTTNDQLRQAEVKVEAQGVRITAAEGNIQSNKTDIATNKAEILVNSDSISQIVTSVGANGEVTAASIVTAINNGASSIAITADHIQITGDTGIIGKLSTQAITVHSLTIDNGGANLGNSNVYYNGFALGTLVRAFGSPTSSDGQISIPYYTLAGTSASYINFNIADTAKYQADIGIESTGAWEWNDVVYERTITPNAGTEAVIGLPTITATAGAFGNDNTCTVSVTGPGNHQITSTTVDASGVYSDGISAGEGQFTLASVTLQGTAHTVTPVGTEHKLKYQQLYESGGTVTAVGNAAGVYVAGTGSYYLRGSSLSRKFYGTLYSLGQGNTPVSEGKGSWFLISNTDVSDVYRGNGTRLKYDNSTYHTSGSTYDVCGTSHYAYVPDSAGTTTYYTAGTALNLYDAGQAVTDTYYTKSNPIQQGGQS
jgi:hypothetical protein